MSIKWGRSVCWETDLLQHKGSNHSDKGIMKQIRHSSSFWG